MRKIVPFIILLLIGFATQEANAQKHVQEARLAHQYFTNGEYEKAISVYEKVYKRDPNGAYTNYLKCLTSLERYDEAEKLIKNQIKKQPNSSNFVVDLGNLYEQQGDRERGEKQYDKAIKMLDNNMSTINALAKNFIGMQEYDYAIQTYLTGRKLLNGSYPFHFELAEAYAQKGDIDMMIEEYLDVLNFRSNYLPNLKTILSNKMNFDLSGELKDKIRISLLRRIQKEEENILYSELLYWLFLQEKDWDSAIIQAKALDKRMDEDGSRMITLGNMCVTNEDYEAAEECFQYVINKGPERSTFLDARMAHINAMNKRITTSNNYKQSDLQRLGNEYEKAINELGKNPATAPLLRQYAHLNAFYLYDIEKAINLLEQAINLPGVKPNFQGECKLDLGDILILKDEVWEATLYYSQVDKAFKQDALGREAKFRNAKLSYYIGEFEWAEAQLNILKAATSQLMSNDALDLALLISDNTALDTSTTALLIFSKADLLAFQNKDNEALSMLDSLLSAFPGHSLTDETWFKKAQLFYKKRNYEKALELYSNIVDQYYDDILADNALFEIARIYQFDLEDPIKAKEMYEKLLLTYPGSLFTVEARKRYRNLRGDRIN